MVLSTQYDIFNKVNDSCPKFVLQPNLHLFKQHGHNQNQYAIKYRGCVEDKIQNL